ncbi:MAG: hypothetical protein UT38_C0022G0021, partial [Microgenomates group bacterium GW2011_GWA2_39_19]
IDTRIKVVPPIILDRVSVDLGPWSGYHLLAQYQKTSISYSGMGKGDLE